MLRVLIQIGCLLLVAGVVACGHGLVGGWPDAASDEQDDATVTESAGQMPGDAGAPPTAPRAGQFWVTAAEVRGWTEKPLWVDARDARDYQSGHIEGAIHLTESGWDRQVVEVMTRWQPGDPGEPIVVYCAGGGCQASEKVARRLQRELGAMNVYALKGGWPAWQASGR